MIDKINALLDEISALKANSNEEIEALRIKYLSKKGEISVLMNDFRNVAAEEKRVIGQKLNELKDKAQQQI
ncbi:MAG: phenylalanine--tRNA ligase subunit alpha, partial [Dysgonamonadaceae bacterium]|nr:phenylalanine--tRNA ligase subunit alpha [Dysgonamonadaceae bacterium]